MSTPSCSDAGDTSDLRVGSSPVKRPVFSVSLGKLIVRNRGDSEVVVGLKEEGGIL